MNFWKLVPLSATQIYYDTRRDQGSGPRLCILGYSVCISDLVINSKSKQESSWPDVMISAKSLPEYA